MISPPKLSAAMLAEGIAAPHSRTIFVSDPSREVATVDVSRSTALKCALMPLLSASGMKSRLHPGRESQKGRAHRPEPWSTKDLPQSEQPRCAAAWTTINHPSLEQPQTDQEAIIAALTR